MEANTRKATKSRGVEKLFCQSVDNFLMTLAKQQPLQGRVRFFSMFQNQFYSNLIGGFLLVAPA